MPATATATASNPVPHPCGCGHEVFRHFRGRGKCVARVNERTKTVTVRTLKADCGQDAPYGSPDWHVWNRHRDACYIVSEEQRTESDLCSCQLFDAKSPEEAARERARDAVACARCSHGPREHPEKMMDGNGRVTVRESRGCRHLVSEEDTPYYRPHLNAGLRCGCDFYIPRNAVDVTAPGVHSWGDALKTAVDEHAAAIFTERRKELEAKANSLEPEPHYQKQGA